MEQEKNKKIDPRAQLTFIARTTIDSLFKTAAERTNTPEDNLYLSFAFNAKPINIDIAGADSIILSDLRIGNARNVYELGVRLYRDGSPYEFEEALSGNAQEQDYYGVYFYQEYPPFVAPSRWIDTDIEHSELEYNVKTYLERVKDGQMPAPKYLTPEEAESLSDIFQSDLAERIDYSELLHEYGRPEN
jgi:hypothetical protein